MWIKFTAAPVNFGYAHFIGDVVDLPKDKAKEVMAASGAIPAEDSEIDAAKAAIKAEQVRIEAEKAKAGPSNADLLVEIAALRKQLADKDTKTPNDPTLPNLTSTNPIPPNPTSTDPSVSQ